MPMETLERYLAANERRRADLDAMIRDEASRPAPDSVRLLALKRRKLRLKELCHTLNRQRAAESVMAQPA